MVPVPPPLLMPLPLVMLPGDWVAALPEPAEGAGETCCVPVGLLVGAILPGEAPCGVTCGEAIDPVGAGAVVESVVGAWARAKPALIINAVEASQIVRMCVLSGIAFGVDGEVASALASAKFPRHRLKIKLLLWV